VDGYSTYEPATILTKWQIQPKLSLVNRSYLLYLLVIPIGFAWPLMHVLVFLLRFGSMPTESSLIFLPMGIVSAVVLVFLVKKTESRKRKRRTVIGYLLASPFAYIGSLFGGLMSPQLAGVFIFGTVPLVLGTALGYKVRVLNEVMNVRISVLPKTSLGRWSVGFAIAWILFFVLSEVILGPGPNYNMVLAYGLTTVDTAIAVAAFVTGLIGIIKNKERSVFVFLATAIGLYGLIGGASSLFGLA